MGVFIFSRWYDFFIAIFKMSNMIFIENAIYSEDDIMTLHALQGGGDDDLDEEDEDLDDEDFDEEDMEDDDFDEEDDESIIDAGEGSDGGSASDGGD